MNKELYKQKINKKIIDIIIDDKLEFVFEEGEKIVLESYHDQDCCEKVYADFDVIQYQQKQILKDN